MLSQARLFGLLQAHQVIEKLSPYDPRWIGSAALDVHIEGSGLDVCCSAQGDLNAFEVDLRSLFGAYPRFTVRREVFGGAESCLAQWQLEAVELQVWGRSHPVTDHEFFRYFKAEEALLRLGGDRLKEDIRAAKTCGLSTEAAFASVLSLTDPPETALLKVYESNALYVMELLKRAGYM